MLVTVTTLKYALLVSWLSCGHFRKLTNSILCEQLHKSSSFNSTHRAKLHPQHGDRILTIDSVTSFHPICITVCMFANRYGNVCCEFTNMNWPKLEFGTRVFIRELYSPRNAVRTMWKLLLLYCISRLRFGPPADRARVINAFIV